MSDSTYQTLSMPLPAAPLPIDRPGALAAFAGWFRRAPAVPARARDAARLREFACRLRERDPAHAADLLAAADRGEN